MRTLSKLALIAALAVAAAACGTAAAAPPPPPPALAPTTIAPPAVVDPTTEACSHSAEAAVEFQRAVDLSDDSVTRLQAYDIAGATSDVRQEAAIYRGVGAMFVGLPAAAADLALIAGDLESSADAADAGDFDSATTYAQAVIPVLHRLTAEVVTACS